MGYPGSCHDANVWRNSPIGKALASGAVHLSQGSHLLGDCAYPLTSYLIVPFRDNGALTGKQINFNKIHSSTRVCIEQAFGILKKKFQILGYLNITSLKAMKYVIFTCTILHNFIIKQEGHHDFQIEVNSNAGENDFLDHQPTEDGAQKRENLADLFIS